MIVNGKTLLELAPIADMATGKYVAAGGTSAGLSEAGYDIRIKQTVFFHSRSPKRMIYADSHDIYGNVINTEKAEGRFILASAMEEFQMPTDLVGIVHDKSTWARRGLSVFNTVIEPGWNGFLTLELVYHGEDDLMIPAGSGIAQVVFHRTTDNCAYEGKYQNQPNEPVKAINSK